MSNENCLAGLRCPNCGSYGPYRIEIKTLATVTDDGTDEYEGADWEDESFCGCIDCSHDGKVADFKDVDNDGNFKECEDCAITRCIDKLHLFEKDGTWFCEECWEEHGRNP